jgi:hypothetical protein
MRIAEIITATFGSRLIRRSYEGGYRHVPPSPRLWQAKDSLVR